MLDLILSPLAILAGCALLYFGGDMLVSASTFIADRIGMSPVAIGATIVARMVCRRSNRSLPISEVMFL